MAETPIRLLIFGAHPDDAEYHAAGLASVYREGGHSVRMISMTDGSAGHHRLLRDEVAAMRRKEAAASAAVIGATCQVWDFSDGELEPTLELRRRVIAEIRNYRPDLVLTHRTNDYHPDHRAAGQVVQDAAFLVRVPHVVPEVPALPSDPIIGCMADLFTRPCPMSADIVLDITPRIDTIVEMLAKHRSQVFEWLPYLEGTEAQVPADEAGRIGWLRDWYVAAIRRRAEHCRARLVEAYGADRGGNIELAEMFEISEYGGALTEPARKRLFPWMG